MASVTIYNRPSRSPSGIQGIIDTLNASGDNLAFPVSLSPIRTGFVRVFGSENGDHVTAITPDPDVALSWHRNRVDAMNDAVIQIAESVMDHRGRLKAVVTGWLAGDDGKNRAFCATPLTPRNPGEVTGYDQQDELVRQFVEACQSVTGKLVQVKQHGMTGSMPVKTGRGNTAPVIQVTGMTAGQLLSGEDVIFDGYAAEFQADPMGQDRPPLQKRGVLRIKGNQYWYPIQPLKAMETMASSGYDVDAFLAELTS